MVDMPLYINFVQEMIWIKLGLKNNEEIIALQVFIELKKL